MSSLSLFHPLTAQWFSNNLGPPTAVQEEAWPAIASGGHTLVSAPTGTGKTLSAFLVFLDRLKAQAREGSLKQELQLIYVSPLKSLAGDIRENLRRPLNGIFEEERRVSISQDSLRSSSTRATPYNLNIAIRTGDTPQNERRSMVKTPPHILITTPESLYLLLTSKSGQKMLKTAKAIILDELHALIDSKRGAHLMLSIARLDKLCPQPLQRIGLSATIEPLSTAAQYLSPEQVTIVAPKMHKEVELLVTSPYTDPNGIKREYIWYELASTVYKHCEGARSVIAFLDGRAYAEKLAYYVNQLGGDGFARTHHGSLSKEHRFEVEHALRNGTLRLLCATSSMELGIDVGDIDLVFQIGCPRSISSTMQRLGRAGHSPGRTSVMHIFPRTSSEGLYSGLTAEVARSGGIEYSRPPRLCLDVLAQHLVSMATGDGYDLDEVMEILPRAYPFREVTKEDVKEVLCMLAGDYEHERELPVRPRILYDRIHERVEGDPYSRMLAVSAAGTIPDMGLFAVKTENGVKIGELDEEFIFEASPGDKFLLGSFAWKIQSIQKDSIIVTPSSHYGAQAPFWKGEKKGRSLQTGLAFGKILGRLAEAKESDSLEEELRGLGLDEITASHAADFAKRQMEAASILPDDHTIYIEHFTDDTGSHQMMVHSVFGKQVNSPLAILAAEAAKRLTKTNISHFDDDDGFLLFPYGSCEIPEGLLQGLKPEDARPILEAILPATPIFNMTFRYNSARALLMGVRKTGRQPLWVQRLRSAELLDHIIQYEKHPLIRETKRECLEDYWDLAGVEYVLNGIRSGRIKVYEVFSEKPSPMALPFRRQAEGTFLYDYTPTPVSIHRAAEDAVQKTRLLAPAAEELARVSERRRLPEDEKQLHSLLMMEGDLIAGELEVPIEWLELLAKRGQALYIEPGLWIAAEQEEKYKSALEQAETEIRKQLVARLLRYRGPQSPEGVGERYLWSDATAEKLLTALCEQGKAVISDGLYYHAELYDRARLETIKSRRRQIKTLPSERYASLLINRLRIAAPPADQLERSLRQLCGQSYPPELWENTLLPARITNYRPELLDNLLSQGNMFWSMTIEAGLGFHSYDEIDWEADQTPVLDTLEGNERIIYDALLKRGASFMQRLSSLIGGLSPYDILLDLAEKGLVCADSFAPVRQWLNRDKLNKSSAKERAGIRAKAMTNGRWEITRPLIPLTIEQQLERAFDRAIILSRETLQGLPWSTALETLRVWEYTGRVRRGYFIEGLSGIQFIRDKDFEGTLYALEQSDTELFWLSAIDPAQPWGKSLPHKQERSFMNIPGNVVALRSGVPIAVFERQGKVLRVFDAEYLAEALKSFTEDYARRRIYSSLNRITVKQYPKEAAEALSNAGFIREMQDYTLYRSSR